MGSTVVLVQRSNEVLERVLRYQNHGQMRILNPVPIYITNGHSEQMAAQDNR